MAYEINPENYREDYLSCLYDYASMLKKPCRIVEIGCYEGQSTIMMAAAISGSESGLYTIDPILKSGKALIPDALKPDGHLREIIPERVLERFRLFGETIHPIPEYSWDAIQTWRLPIDLLFVDGEHTREAVTQDLEWMAFVRAGGYAAFDDWIDPIERTVMDYIDKYKGWRVLHESTDPLDGIMSITLFQRN